MRAAQRLLGSGQGLTLALVMGALATMAGGEFLRTEDAKPTQVVGESSVEDDETRRLLEKWVEARRVISAERQAWILGRDILKERISLVQQEIDQNEAAIAEAENSVKESEAKLETLTASSESFEAGAEVLESTVVKMEDRLRKLLPMLPPPLVDQVASLTQSLKDEESAAKVSLSIRYRNLVGTLTLIDKFHTQIHKSEETRQIGAGSHRVDVLYLGLSVAYYASADGKLGGVGQPGPAGYVWTEKNGAAADIRRAIDMHGGGQVADFVRLPVPAIQ